MTDELNRLWAELRYHQTMNRVAARQLLLGIALVKRLAQAIRTYDKRQNQRARRRVA